MKPSKERSSAYQHLLKREEKKNLERETKSLLIAAQNNAKSTNYIKARTEKTQQIATAVYVAIETKRSIVCTKKV